MAKDLRQRAEEANAAGLGPFKLYFTEFNVQHQDVRALLILASGLMAQDHAWYINDCYGNHWSAWVPRMPKPDIPVLTW